MMRGATAGAPQRLRSAIAAALAAIWLASPTGGWGAEARFDGFNIIAAAKHPFGSPSAARALMGVKRIGAAAVAVIPFLWQPDRASAKIVRGSDMPDRELRAGIRAARGLGLKVLVKPHVWVPESWAGAVEPASEPAWRDWFVRYRGEITRIARIAAEEGADAFAVGTELVRTTHRPEWSDVIAAVRAVFPRLLLYVAHNVEEAEAVPFWPDLDMIAVSLYPALGADDDGEGRRAVMQATAVRLDRLAARFGKPVIVAEVGLRSAKDATEKPWESAEERSAAPDPELQARVLAEWLEVLDRPAVRGVLVWRWFTDPDGGGPADTDFTVQGKPAEEVLFDAWMPRGVRP
ncbi:MAG: glycoside hydrolase family 113 [Xanthobacteraceae bacterium]